MMVTVVVVVGCVLVIGAADAEETGRIFGQVTGADGALSGVEVQVVELGQSRVTDANGTFRFDGVPAGSYTLQFRLGENTDTLESVEVKPGSTALLDQYVEWEPAVAQSFTVFAASRRTQRLVEAPAAVTTLSQDEIEPQATHGLIPKLLEFTLGADISRSSLWDFNFNSRGFNSSLNRRVLVLFDGRDPVGVMLGAQEWPANPFPLDDVATIEFVRGPGSALYGANAYNGVLNLTTTEARYSEGGFFRVAGGELSTAKVDFRQGGSLGESWTYKVLGGWEESDDFSESRTQTTEYPGIPLEPVPLEDIDNNRYYASLRLSRYASSGAVFSAEVGAAKVEGPVYQTGIGRVQVISSERPYARVNYNSAHFNFLAYWDARDADQRSLSSGSRLFDDSSKLHVELQAHTSFAGDRGRLVGGVSYREEEADSVGPGGFQTIISGERNEDAQGVFGQLEYQLTDSLSAVLAARWDDSTLHDEQVSPKASLVYAFNPDHTLRLSYNEAFQTPSYLDRFLRISVAPPVDLSAIEAALEPYLGGASLGFDSVPVLALGNEDLQVEEITTYEIGYAGIIQGKALLNINYYQSDLESFVTELLPGVNPAYGPYAPPAGLPPDIQALILQLLQENLPPELLALMSNDADGDPIFAAFSYTNSGQVDAQGVELGLTYYFQDRWSLFANYSWLDFDVQEKLAGEQLLPNAPENRASVGVTYTGAAFDLSLRARWVDEFVWGAGLFDGTVDSYELVDLSARYLFGRGWELGVNVSNLLDEEHIETFGGDVLGRRALAHVAYRW
jgi:iron complex outermembrane receptor protein